MKIQREIKLAEIQRVIEPPPGYHPFQEALRTQRPLLSPVSKHKTASVHQVEYKYK